MPVNRKQSGIIEIEHKTVRFEVKASDEPGRFTGVASVMGVEDLGGDIIEPTAFDKTLKENPEVATLWQHYSDEVIGSAALSIDGNKLIMDGRLDMEDPVAVKAYSKMKKKLVRGLSIGFQAIKVMWEETKEGYIRHINELKLWEVSIVTFPMQPEAQITAVKRYSLADDLSEGAIAAAERERKAGQRLSAATRDKINAALATLQALLAEEGTSGEDDAKTVEPPEAAAGNEAAAISAEPVMDHSALSIAIQRARLATLGD